MAPPKDRDPDAAPSEREKWRKDVDEAVADRADAAAYITSLELAVEQENERHATALQEAQDQLDRARARVEQHDERLRELHGSKRP